MELQPHPMTRRASAATLGYARDSTPPCWVWAGTACRRACVHL